MTKLLDNLLVGALMGIFALGLAATISMAYVTRTDFATFWMGLMLFSAPNGYRFIQRLA